jgi:hypothetical protein
MLEFEIAIWKKRKKADGGLSSRTAALASVHP